jgi:hypothetical protein
MPSAHDPDLHPKGHEAQKSRPLSRRSVGVRLPQLSEAGLEAAVSEAVFRYQLRQPLLDPPRPPRYYLALQGGDPGDALLHRLRALAPGIQPLSHCRVTARDGVIDRATGARGVILQVARLAWVHAAAMDVVGGYYITHRQAAGLRYDVAHDGHHWAVTAAHLLWRV